MSEFPDALSSRLHRDRAYYADQISGLESGRYRVMHISVGQPDRDVSREYLPGLRQLVDTLELLIAQERARND